MAFCVRSERKMDYIKFDNNNNINIGPGYYFQSSDKNYIKRRIHPPFQISTQRGSLYKTNDNPGPGSYELIDKSYPNNKDSTYNSTKNNNKKKEKEKEKNISTIKNNISSIVLHSGSRNHNNSSDLLEVSKNTNNINNKSNINISENNETDTYININNNNINKSNNLILSKIKKFAPNYNLSDIIINYNSKEFITDIVDYDLITPENNTLNIDKNKKKNKLISLHLKIDAGSLKRIVSIPSKDMNGYVYDFNKTLNLLIDRTNTKEYIGPGRYNIKLKNKPKSILEWSKTLNLKEIKKRKDNEKRKETLEELKQRGDFIPKLSKFRLNKNKNYHLLKSHFISGNQKKGLNDLNTKYFSNNINRKPNLFFYSRDSFLLDKNDVPGPGYYTRDLIDKNKNRNNKGKNVTITQTGFGSSCNRFLYKSKTMQDLGPTTYFIEKNKFEVNKKPDLLSHLRNKSIADDMVKTKKIITDSNKKTDIPGPGTYDLTKSFINKSYGKYPSMSLTNIRFKYKYNDNPGPGTYYHINNTSNINSINNIKTNLKLKKIVNKTIEEEAKKKLKIFENISKDKKRGVPGVGTYNLEEIDSINNKIIKKYNPKLSFNSPFLMSSGRFNYKYDKIDSPMYDNNYVKKNMNYMGFSKAERFNYMDQKNNSVYLVGPGSYNLNKDEIWNKKSFNKLFCS